MLSESDLIANRYYLSTLRSFLIPLNNNLNEGKHKCMKIWNTLRAREATIEEELVRC